MKAFKFIMMAFAIASMSAAFVSCGKDDEVEIKGNEDQKQPTTLTLSMTYVASAYLSPNLVQFFDIEGYKYTKNGDEVAKYDGVLYRDTIDVKVDKPTSFGYYFKTKMTKKQLQDDNALTEKLKSLCNNDSTLIDSIQIYYSSIVMNTNTGMTEYKIESKYDYVIDYFNDPESTAKSIIEKKGRFGAAAAIMKTYLTKGAVGCTIKCNIKDGVSGTTRTYPHLECAE